MKLSRFRRSRGFTLLEMLTVAALVGILTTMAMANYKHARRKAQESVLHEQLWTLRTTLDQFYTDKGKYPSSLDELVTAGYIRKVPEDPFTGSSEWDELMDDEAIDAPEDPEEEPGIKDVRSFAEGTGLDGTAYSEW